ncbi:filamentous hemagglutinin N-terminal domain-containing protein [Vreelandella rituensis]
MNKIYQSIWKQNIGTFVAGSEFAKSGSRKNSNGSNRVSENRVLFILKPLIASIFLAVAGNAWALPVGGEVSVGSVNISGDTTVMDITQTTQNAAINWQAFDITSGEAVNFVQPNSSSISLNRVLGSDPSAIMGTLTANGSVFLINPNGVLFGKDASVNVGGLVASTLAISDSDFAAGNFNFVGTGDGSIVNQGTINADGGYVALLGANVSNQGTLQANLGTVALAAGDAITLDVAGDGLLNVAVNQGALDALVQNGGMIQADGGKVLMTAQSAGDLLQSSVNNTGVLRAQSIENRNGTIMLMGDIRSGTVKVGGSLDVSSADAGETGGSVTATAHHVGLYDALIDASGDAGGGSVLIGGGYQGKDLAVQNASATYMSAGSNIYADAITTGDGGTAVLWADNSTRAYGSISARGGEQAGDGGLMETSGGWLDVADIRIDTRAPNGTVGMWLLDPADITISSAATTGATPTDNVFAPDSGVSAANINVADLVTGLGASNITVATENSGASGTGNGDITVMNAITWTDQTILTLNADRDVNINAAITGTDGSLVANADRNVNVNAVVTTTTGDLTFNAKNDVTLTGASTITTGNLTALAGKDVNVGAAITVTTGDVILIADNDGTGPGADIGGTVDITCAECITINTGTLRVRFNPASYADTNTEIGAYDLNLKDGGGTLDAKAWVFGLGDDKVYDGLRDTTVSGLEPDINGIQPEPTGELEVSNAEFDTKDVGTEKLITYQASFDDTDYELFAPFGTTEGTYVTRADITPAQLTITANDAEKESGVELDPETLTYEQEGLVPGETIGDVTLTSPGIVATADVGDYVITPSDAEPGTFDPGNYAINYVEGTLLVTAVAVDPVDPIPDPVDTTVPGDTTDPVDPSTTDPSTTDPSTTDPGDPVAPISTDPETTDPVEPDPLDPSTTDPDETDSGSEPSLPLAAALPPEEALRPVISFPDESGYSPEDISEGLALTFATAAVNMPTSQLERLESPAENDLVTQPDAYVPPVYAPKQDRF